MTASGDVKTTNNVLRNVCLFTGLTSANGQPALATDGVPCYPDLNNLANDTGACFVNYGARDSSIVIKGSAAGGPIAFTGRMWGYNAQLAEWVPMGTGTDAAKGLINAGAAIGPVKTLKVLHGETLKYAGHYDRLYLEATVVGGTTPTFEAWVVTLRNNQ